MKNIFYGVGISLFAYAAFKKFYLKQEDKTMDAALISSVAILGVTYFVNK